MSKVLIYFLGLVSGCVLTILGVALIAVLVKTGKDTEPKYFDIDFKDKTYVLHTEMPKDSVEMALGKPETKRYETIENVMHETWLYREDNQDNYDGYDVMRLVFEDGKLVNIDK